MKKLFALALLGSATVLTACSNNYAPANTTFGANQNQVMTVAQVKNAYDDARVMMEGNIVAQVRGEHYTFRDATGEITVEIDHDKWYGLSVTPTDTVVIFGEVDKEFFSTKVDVKHITKK